MQMNRRAAIILFIVVLFATLESFLIFREYPITWDEGAFIGMGKHIYSSGQSGIWEDVRPLGLPLVFGFFWKIGLGSAFFYRFFSFLSAVGVLAVVFLIGRKFIKNYLAGFAAVLVGFSPVFFYNSRLATTDVISLLFALLAIYFFLEQKYFLSGFFAGLAFMVRFPHGLIIGVILFSIILFDNKEWLKKSGSFLAVPLFITGIFLFFSYITYADSSSSVIEAMFRQFSSAIRHQDNLVYSIDGFASNLLYYLQVAFSENPLFLLSIPGILIFVRKTRGRILSLAVALLAYFAYFTWILNKEERFFIAFLPFAAMLAAYWVGEFVPFLLRLRMPLMIPFVLMIAVLLVSSSISVYAQVREQYSWLPDNEMLDLYKHFDGKNSTVLTAHPAFSAYSGNLFIQFYENPDEAMIRYGAYKDKVDFIVYTPQFYPCERFGPECEQKKALLIRRISDENHLMLNKTIGNMQYYIFSATSS